MTRIAFLFAVAGSLTVGALALGHKPTSIAVPTPPRHAVITVPISPRIASGPGSLTLGVSLSDPLLVLGGARDEYLKIDLTGVAVPASQRAAVNLAVVLDRSGSMAGEKIESARQAAHALVDRLDERDRLAFITFGSNVTPLFASTVCTASARAQMHRSIDRIYDMGGTNLSGGLQAGIRAVSAHAEGFAVNRVILISDGEANEGITSRPGLTAIARSALGQHISVTSLGVGVDFDEDTMQQLAENGGGNYRFLATGAELAPVFDHELSQLAALVAGAPVIRLSLAPGVQLTEVYGHAHEVDDTGATILRLSDLAAGEHRKVVLRLSVPASAIGPERVAEVGLTYTDLLHDRASASAQASLDAQVTPDSGLAANQRNRETYAQVARVQAAAHTRRAAVLYGSGDVAQAQEELEKGRAEGRKMNEVARDDTFGAALDRLAPPTSMAAPVASPAAKSAIKTLKRNAYQLSR